MLLNRTYYLLKPYLPYGLRVSMRRIRAKVKLSSSRSTWPIDPSAGFTPPNWPGWAGGKKFAFVLTHDVEGTKGLERVKQLMDLELAHGFRSCFNFVPESEYRLPAGLRAVMEKKGFEIGVHGLYHDGKLYNSKEGFATRADKIRGYLQEWKSVGFRSPLMQHNLAWLHQLGVEYDASTFDTDPFEPESDGYRTIFPFWVANPDGAGYVELPYSIPQDFTLFEVLQQRDNNVWKRKLDWVAEHGGMALINTHPDYMSFKGARCERDEFPAEMYSDFLSYVRAKYEGSYWHVNPRELASYYRESLPIDVRNTRKKVCMIAYSNYECDNRVRRYAEALVARGDIVDVIAVGGGERVAKHEVIKGVNVYRIQQRERNEGGKWTYAFRLMRFLAASSIALAAGMLLSDMT